MYTRTQALVLMVTDVSEFHFVGDLPKREKTKVRRLFDVLDDLDNTVKVRGALVPQVMVAEILGVQRQRVSTLIAAGRLEAIDVGGYKQVFTESIREFARKEPLKPGRPKLVPA